MDILISDNWLRDFLTTDAKPSDIAKNLSLCGPSVDKVEKTANDVIYSIEVTTNRADSASVYGIAREASAILPKFGFKTKLNPVKNIKLNMIKKVSYLEVKVDSFLCPRFSAVLVKNVKIGESPPWMKERLAGVGVRPINNIVDISNYIMHELGQPVHTFDFDKIGRGKMILRESRKGEKITTLDGLTYQLNGGEIVIEDGHARLIDLAGIMGGANSAVEASTKNVLLFVQTYNPTSIRRASMSLSKRTEASMLFEKSLDPELVSAGIYRGIKLFSDLTKGVAEKQILDIYPSPYKSKRVSISLLRMNKLLGLSITKDEISQILSSLGFEISWKADVGTVAIPSWRSRDVSIPEDIFEEVARIKGYHNLPDGDLEGKLPEPLEATTFNLEDKIKDTLVGYGGIEIYTLSLVPKEFSASGALRLKNPLGKESEFLRTSLKPSLLLALEVNSGINYPYFLFEIANVYLPVSGKLPHEKNTLAAIFVNTSFREARGIVESLFWQLNLEINFVPQEDPDYLPGRSLVIKSGAKTIARLGMIESDTLYFEAGIEEVAHYSKNTKVFTEVPKYPPQIEDITLTFPHKVLIGEVLSEVGNEKLISKVELKETYQDSYTFRLWYQDPTKTLTDTEVKEARLSLLKKIGEKFGGNLKS